MIGNGKAVTAAPLKAALRRAPGFRFLQILWRLRNQAERNVLLLDWEQPAGLFQPYPTTAPNRYPALFNFVRDRIGDGRERRVLSFGCATGEEVFALRDYFPKAGLLKGIDINRRNIATCRRALAARNGDPALQFEVAASAEREPPEFYDAVFALAVFRHGGVNAARPRCDHLIGFEAFDRCVQSLAACLRPGGLLIVRHANFRLSDTVEAAHFRTLFSPQNPDKNYPPIYSRDDRLAPGRRGDDGVHQKCELAKSRSE
jgi:SAM-dependent methyltransferase